MDELRQLTASLDQEFVSSIDGAPRVTNAKVNTFQSQLHGLRANLWNGSAHDVGFDAWLETTPPPIANSPEALYWRVQLRMVADRSAHELRSTILASLGALNHPDLVATLSELCLRGGEPEIALDHARAAVSLSRTPHTLVNLGRMLGVSRPAEGVRYIREGLRAAEIRGDPYFIASASNALAARMNVVGKFVDAVTYARWGTRIYDAHRLRVPSLLDELTNEAAYAVLLSSDSEVDVSDQLRALEQQESVASSHRRQTLRLTGADLRLALGDVDAAHRAYREQWETVTSRGPVGSAANLYVRALLEMGSIDEALRVGDRAVRLTEGLPEAYRRRALLAHAIALSMEDSSAGVDALKGVMAYFTDPLLTPGLLQTGLYLVLALRELERHEEASVVMDSLRPHANDVGTYGLRYLVGPQRVFEGLVADVRPQGDVLRLEFFGRPRAYRSGKPVQLRQRFMDILAVLALHPEGIDAESLTLAVFGESASPSRTRVDVSKLRSVLPIGTKPYRLGLRYDADFIRMRQFIERGQLAQAVSTYTGPLLPKSSSPWVQEERLWLERILIESVIASDDADLVFLLAQRMGTVPELWDALRHLLAHDDPRFSTASALLNRTLT